MPEIENKILTSKGEELSMVLGEVLGEPITTHSYETLFGHSYRCRFCGLELASTAEFSLPSIANKCNTRFTPIPLDWPNAMKWRDWAVEKFGEEAFSNALIDVWTKTDHNEQGPNFIAKAQPEHYLKAAALCVERKDK